ncbi:DNA cytosine methyltransferase [Priestia aryabhattai]
MQLAVVKKLMEDKSSIIAVRNYRTSYNPKNKERTRLWLEKTVLRLANLLAGTRIILQSQDSYLKIRKAKDLEMSTHTISYRKNGSTGELDPLLDVCNKEVHSVLGVGVKIDVIIKEEELIIYKELSFEMFNGINKTEFWNDDSKKFRVVSLFGGGGAMTSGFVNTQACESVMAVDSDIPDQNPYDYQLKGKAATYTSWVVETFKKNFPKTFFYWGDIRSINPIYIPKADIVLVSAPCVEYSGLGLQMKGLIEHFASHIVRIILETGAFAVFFENVPQYFKSQVFKTIKDMLSEVFPEQSYTERNSYDDSAIESRNRGYFVAFRDKTNFEFPEHPKVPNSRRKKVKHFLDDESTVKWRPIEGTVMNSFLTTHKEKFKDTGFTVDSNKMLVSTNDNKVSCFVKGYGKIQSVCSYLSHPTDNRLWRLFTPNEIMKFMNYPSWFQFPENMPMTTKYEVLGNSVNVISVEAIASRIVSALMSYKIKMQMRKQKELEKLSEIKSEIKKELSRLANLKAKKTGCLFCS